MISKNHVWFPMELAPTLLDLEIQIFMMGYCDRILKCVLFQQSHCNYIYIYIYIY